MANIFSLVKQKSPNVVYFSLKVHLSNTMYIHERKSDTILNVLGDIGGFNDAILLIVGPLMLYYSSL